MSFLGAYSFECPKDNGMFPDEVQCDKYYSCKDGKATEELCQDGLVFGDNIENRDNPWRTYEKNKKFCDQPYSVLCGNRTKLRELSSFADATSTS